VVSLIFALFAGVGTRSQWNNWVLLVHASKFPTSDQQFHKNIGFYVFQLPFINFVLNWLFVALIITLIVTIIFHYLNGGIRLQSATERVTPQVKAHVSVLLGALALVKAVGYWFDRYGLVLSTKHVVDGATYTDVHASLPAKNLLILIAVAAAVLFHHQHPPEGLDPADHRRRLVGAGVDPRWWRLPGLHPGRTGGPVGKRQGTALYHPQHHRHPLRIWARQGWPTRTSRARRS